jgi:hypothetical protein
MLACNVIPRLAELFNDKEPSVRRNAHKAVSMYSESPPGKHLNIIKFLIRLVFRCTKSN